MKIRLVFKVFIILVLCVSCTKQSSSSSLSHRSGSFPVLGSDTSQQVFSLYDPQSITKITIMNCQFEADTSLTNMNCRRNLSKNQIIQFCEIINRQSKTDTLLDPHIQQTEFIISIHSTDKEVRSSLLYFYSTHIITSWNIQLEKCGYKKWPKHNNLQKFWDEAICPPIYCDVLIDREKIPLVDSLSKKANTNLNWGVIKADSGDYFLMSLSPSCGESGEGVDSIWIKKGNGITTLATIHGHHDTFLLYERPFNSAKIIYTIPRPKNYMDGIEVVVLNCYMGWLKIKMVINKKNYTGWIQDYCSNPCTTCS